MIVIPFPVKASADIAKEARDFADAIEAGEFGRVDSAIILTSGAALNSHYWGDSFDPVLAVGVLETAKHYVIQQMLEE